MKKRYPDLDNEILKQLANPHKVRMVQILKGEKQINQLDLQKKLNISYRQTRRYIKALTDSKIIKKRTVKKKPGSPVFISLK